MGLTRDEFTECAWRDFVVWAWGEPKMRTAFEHATGTKLMAPARNGLDAMIDAATGVHQTQAVAFVDWVTINHWGADEAPKKWRDVHQTAVSAE